MIPASWDIPAEVITDARTYIRGKWELLRISFRTSAVGTYASGHCEFVSDFDLRYIFWGTTKIMVSLLLVTVKLVVPNYCKDI